VCGLDFSFADAGDGPAIFVIKIAGAIVVAAAPQLAPRRSMAATRPLTTPGRDWARWNHHPDIVRQGVIARTIPV